MSIGHIPRGLPAGHRRAEVVVRGPDAREVLGKAGTVLLREIDRLGLISQTGGLDNATLNLLVKVVDAATKFSREMRELDRGDEEAIRQAAERLAEDALALSSGEE